MGIITTSFLLKNIISLKLINSKIYFGHTTKIVNLKLLYYFMGIRHNIIIFNLERVTKNLRIIYCIFVEIVTKRGFFLLFGANTNIPLPLIMSQFLKKYSMEYQIQNENLGFYITGYFSKNWMGGTFTNWKKVVDFLHIKNKLFSIQKNNFIVSNLNIDSMYKKYYNITIIPDFLFCFDSDKVLLKEAYSLDIPIIGIIDSNDDFKNFFFKLIGNNDSIESIFFFLFIY